MILSDMKRDVKNDPSNFNLADYFNIFSSFITLKEDEEVIKIAFDKLRSAEGSCEYFLASKMFKSSKYDILREEINNQIISAPNNDELYAQRAAIHVNQNDYQSAINDLERAIKIDSNNANHRDVCKRGIQ